MPEESLTKIIDIIKEQQYLDEAIDMETNGKVIVKTLEEFEELEKWKYDKKDLYSERINLEYRLVYHIENNNLIITSCKYHYNKE